MVAKSISLLGLRGELVFFIALRPFSVNWSGADWYIYQFFTVSRRHTSLSRFLFRRALVLVTIWEQRVLPLAVPSVFFVASSKLALSSLYHRFPPGGLICFAAVLVQVR